jgi:glucose-6-phosphate isomerase
VNPVSIDPRNLLAPALGARGIDPARLTGDLSERFLRAHVDVTARRESGEMGFFALPYDLDGRRQVQGVADSFGQWFESLVVIGIGGSSLGAKAVADALRGPFWNERSAERRDHFPRLYFLENADPDTTRALLEVVDPRTTLFNVVSKSGSTAETMAQYLVIEGILRDLVGPDRLAAHLLFTTDAEHGALRRIAGTSGVPSLSVPSAVGGRFSVLSAVGLLPAAVVGVDVEGLLSGAAQVEARCRTERLSENPAGLLATLLHAHHEELGRSIHVFMPYVDRLRTLGLWFQQLWAESLGKARDRNGRVVHTGPTPVAALGAVDQHSLLQLLMEGPDDKVTCVVSAGEREDPVEIPRGHEEIPSLRRLGGHTLGGLLEMERRATVEALRRTGRPSVTLEIPRLDAPALGGLLMLLEVATAYAGALYGVDPLDQPGVEMGKELTYEMLEGRPAPEAPAREKS